MARSKIAKMEELLAVIDHFRTIDPEYPAQIMSLILHVAKAPGLTMSALAERVGTSLSSVSRIVERLGARWGMTRAGDDLVSVEENPANRREKLVSLSAKGERFVQTLLTLTE